MMFCFFPQVVNMPKKKACRSAWSQNLKKSRSTSQGPSSSAAPVQSDQLQGPSGDATPNRQNSSSEVVPPSEGLSGSPFPTSTPERPSTSAAPVQSDQLQAPSGDATPKHQRSSSGVVSASRRKLECSSEKLQSDRLVTCKQQWMFMHIDPLSSLFDGIPCPECLRDTLFVEIIHKESRGFATKLRLYCRTCDFSKSTMTSPRSRYAGIPYASDKYNCPYDINKRMVLYSHGVGSSHSALEKFTATVGIPNMHLKTYQKHDKRLVAVEIFSGQHAVFRAADEVRTAHASLDEDYADRVKDNVDMTGEPLDISVSFDGTWQKRGFTSLYGVGVVIEVTTGLVIDFEVLSKYCHACKLAESKGMSDDDFFEWREGHLADCCINFEGSSKAMESEAARRMWRRSLTKHNFRYVDMISDGDSSAFKAVSELKCYGDTEIKKLECVNHAHKRMGSALRKLSKEERLGGRGRGRLTEAKCKDLQNFYRGAIVNNLGDTSSMRNSIWAGLWHSMSTDEEPHHLQCPEGEDSWCFYQKALANDQTPPSHTDHRSSTFLARDVAHRLLPIYRRMSDETLLNRMRHGKTQNANESFNNLIWLSVPKTMFFGKNRVDAAVARAVLRFNEGAEALTLITNKLHVDLTEVSLQSMRQTDKRRICKAEKKSQDDEIKRRKAYGGKKFLEIIALEAGEEDKYREGMF